MELTNEIYALEPLDEGVRPEVQKEVLELLTLMLAPMTPHIAAEMWEMLGHEEGQWTAAWPAFDAELARETEVEIVVQVNGRVRGKLKVAGGNDVKSRSFRWRWRSQAWRRISRKTRGETYLRGRQTRKPGGGVMASTAKPSTGSGTGRMEAELGGVVVLDFGGQYTQLIARRIREQQVFSSILPCTTSMEEMMKLEPVGVVLSGGPSSVYDPEAPKCDPKLLALGVPVLGICYGMQWITHTLGGKVERCRAARVRPSAAEY